MKEVLKYRINLAFFVIIVFCFSCTPEKHILPEYNISRGVFICNEGNFTFGNASLSFYEPDSSKVHNQVFYNTNGFPVGDVLQSIEVSDSLAYMVINNSGKIFVINNRSFHHEATIQGFSSPRYMHIINENKAYVSQMHSPYLRIIDLVKNEISGEIFIGRSTERMVSMDELVFVTSWSFSNMVYLLNLESDILLDSLEVVKQPNSLVLDKNNKLWVLSDGGFPGTPYGQENASLTKIDAKDFLIEKVFHFRSFNASPSHLNINASRDTLFFLNSSWISDDGWDRGVYRMHIEGDELPEYPFIEEGSKKFYSLAIDPVNTDIYVSDVVDGVQKAWIFRYNSDAMPADSFRVDVLPGHFSFLNE